MAVITAQEASQIISQEQKQLNGSRLLPPTLARIRKMQADEAFPICNVGPWEYRLERASLMIYVPGYDSKLHPEGYAASDPMPDIRREAKIVNENEYSYYEDDGRVVALDLIGMGFGLPSKNALVQYGVFVPAGRLPVPSEIAEANRCLNNYIDRLIADARDAYDKGPQERANVITPERHVWAARQRGLNEAWVHHQHTQQSNACPSCGRFNPANIAKCACGTIVDFDLHFKIETEQKRRLKDFEDEQRLEEATKPGKK